MYEPLLPGVSPVFLASWTRVKFSLEDLSKFLPFLDGYLDQLSAWFHGWIPDIEEMTSRDPSKGEIFELT